MTYVELARAVRARMGLQGSGPSDVGSTIPIEQQIVQAVYDTWIDIQNYRTDWRWMRNTDSFETSAGVTVYALSSIFDPGYRFRNFHKETFYVTVDNQKQLMRFLNYDTFQQMYNNTDTNNKFYDFTIRPWDNAVVIPPPDAVYTVNFDYQKSNQLLANNSDTPEMPTQHHNLIVYGALEKMGIAILSMEQYDHYSQQYAIEMGQLMREQIPKKTVKTRSIA